MDHIFFTCGNAKLIWEHVLKCASYLKRRWRLGGGIGYCIDSMERKATGDDYHEVGFFLLSLLHMEGTKSKGLQAYKFLRWL